MTREEIVEAITKCHRELGHVPTREELSKMAGVSPSLIYHRFDSYTEAVRLAGLEPQGGPYRMDSESLLLDWATVARKIGRLPTKSLYTKHGRFSTAPFEWRWLSWSAVGAAFKAYVEEKALQREWADVLEMIEARLRPLGMIRWKAEVDGKKIGPSGLDEIGSSGDRIIGTGKHSAFSNQHSAEQELGSRNSGLSGDLATTPAGGPTGCSAIVVTRRTESLSAEVRPRLQPLPGRPVYGDPMFIPGMTREPVNEAGVIFVFGMMAHRLGFAVERLQASFPDCEAMRQIEPGRWQRVGIEFEYESRNFERHGHEIDGCDLIVCWVHNWKECPAGLEVIELRRAMGGIG